MPSNHEDRLFGSMSDGFLAKKVIGDPATNATEKELALRILVAKARAQLADIREPFEFAAVSSTGGAPLVQPGDQILAIDGQ